MIDPHSSDLRPNDTTVSKDKPASCNRGFASMDPKVQRQIASKGGKAAHEKGTAHEYNQDEARVAGRKGGAKVSQNREHMAEIGSKGGKARGKSRSKTKPPLNTTPVGHPYGGGESCRGILR